MSSLENNSTGEPGTLHPAPQGVEAGFPPWNIWQAVGVVLFFILVQIAASLAIVQIISFFFQGAGSGLELELMILRIEIPLSILISHSLSWGAIYLMISRWHHRSFIQSLRLQVGNAPPFIKAFFGGVLLQFVSLILILYFPPPPDFVSPIEQYFQLGSWAVAVLFVVAVIMAPSIEEVIFRGIMYPAIRRRTSIALAVLTTSIIFTLLHVSQNMGYWPPMAGIFLCGLLLALLREKTDSLWPPIAFHAGFNITPFLSHFLLGSG